ncbi:MAG: hypothetical protein HY781_07830 [Chloroflexi bacterium]|nr:hypothetical protein [Chloroflexota bacterium]
MTLSLVILVFVVVILAVAIAAVVYTVSQHHKGEMQAHLRAKDFVARQANAVWASATIVSARGGIIGGGEGGVSQWARYELSLEVTPPGGAPYHARTTWLVEVAQMSMLQQGQQLSVKIDQQDPKTVYPNASWAKYVPG